MLDIHTILENLPHRYPFLLVDRIIEVDAEHAIGLKNVTFNEPFFQGHFPKEPVMPGVLVLEAMGQVAAMMIINRPDSLGDMAMYLTGIEKAKIRRPVVPGDQLTTTAKMEKLRGRIGRVSAVARVGDDVAAEALFGFVIAKALTGDNRS